MRRAARVDNNQRDIVDALRKIGAKVWLIGRPVDALVAYRKQTYLMEFKNKEWYNNLTQDQADFFDEWNGGPLLIIHTPEQAIEAIT